MGPIVRLIGSGIGLASEAIAHRKQSKAQQQLQAASSSTSIAGPASPPPPASSSRNQPPVRELDDAPPEYVEVADERTADKLVKSGQAERITDYGDEKKGHEEHDEESDSSTDMEGDEAVWELDEMANGVATPTYEESESSREESLTESQKEQKEEDLIKELVRMAGSPPVPPRKLPASVVLPQRRPRQKDRGFVRAYAPVLKDCGISQEVFLKFLKSWHQASKASPWIDVVFISAGIVGFVPEATSQIISTVVQVIAGTARELQSRSRRNTFLDRANQDLFMPRGLYAMIMSFKDDIPAGGRSGPLSRLSSQIGTIFAAERLDINQTAKKYSNPDPNMSKTKQALKNIRLTSGKTVGQLELPEAAELVFPDIDHAVEVELDGTVKGKEKEGAKEKWKNTGKFVQDYLDRRAQAKYANENPGSKLAVSNHQFASRFSDPNHPANSGSLLALLTGGAINPRGLKPARRELRDERRSLKREFKDARRIARGRSPRGPGRQRLSRSQRQGGIIKKVLQQDVLYLLVVNLPTDQEVDESVHRLESLMMGTEGGVQHGV